MIRINIITEGQTEESFIRDILAPELALKNIFPVARSVETSRTKTKIHRGGLVSYEKAKRDIERWLKQDEGAYVTTMFDLYALPQEFPGTEKAAAKTDPFEKVALLEEELFKAINFGTRFIPYIQLHEYEGLLFSDAKAIDDTLKLHCGSQLDKLLVEIGTKNPELINEGAETAPSKRLLKLYPSYEKVTNGVVIAKNIGLKTLREKCSHFNEWLSKIEQLPQ